MSRCHCLLLGLLLLPAACSRAPPSDAALPGLGQGDGQAQWGGTLPCADCDGIVTQLVLRRHGEDLRYRIVETYVSSDNSARFVEQGTWTQMQTGLLRMQGDNGARHVFAVLDDGSLQPRDSAGKPFFDRDDDVLAPLHARRNMP